MFAKGSRPKSCSPVSTRCVMGEDGKSFKNKLDRVTYLCVSGQQWDEQVGGR